MGCGKSTVGRVLSTLLGCDFVDMDTYIERQEGQSVSAIFAQHGEAYFRRLEADACVALAVLQNTVIAAGGGALSPDNARTLAAHCVIVLIDVPFELLAVRLAGDQSRPLFRDQTAAKVLFDRRRPIYQRVADFVVDGTLPPDQVAKKIGELISLYNPGNASPV